MPKFKVLLLKHGYPSVEIERQIIERAGGELVDAETLREEETIKLAEEVDGLLVRWANITPDLIKRLHRCKMILRYGVGFDNVDLDASTEAGIMVGHVPNYCLDDVSTHAIALL